MSESLRGSTVLVMGAALGHILALACASARADVIVHDAHSPAESAFLQSEIRSLGRQADPGCSFQAENLILPIDGYAGRLRNWQRKVRTS